jgi:polyribonucleotide nucleotidyltransferase
MQIAGKQRARRRHRRRQGRGRSAPLEASELAGRRLRAGRRLPLGHQEARAQRILTDKVRIDGRGLTDIRPLSAEVRLLPRVHGSALFERGETQILGVTTLNMLRMEQQIDSLSPIDQQALHAPLQLPALLDR